LTSRPKMKIAKSRAILQSTRGACGISCAGVRPEATSGRSNIYMAVPNDKYNRKNGRNLRGHIASLRLLNITCKILIN